MDELKDIPVVDVGGPFPGGWKLDEESGYRVWKGEMNWVTLHGDAKVRWMLGSPMAAFGAMLRDGGRIERVETFSPAHKDWWRRPNQTGDGYVSGRLSIEQHGVVFTDEPMPEVKGRGGLEDDIEAHPKGVELLRDDGFAGALNEYMKNKDFRRDGESDGKWGLSFRSIAGMIAEIRGIGESYTDFYPWGVDHTETDTRRVEAFIAELGWHAMTSEEIAADHSKAMEMLEEIEKRDEGVVPKSERVGIDYESRPRRDRGKPSDRMHAASASGRATAEEHNRFFSLYDSETDMMTVEEASALFGSASKPPMH